MQINIPVTPLALLCNCVNKNVFRRFLLAGSSLLRDSGVYIYIYIYMFLTFYSTSVCVCFSSSAYSDSVSQGFLRFASLSGVLPLSSS